MHRTCNDNVNKIAYVTKCDVFILNKEVFIYDKNCHDLKLFQHLKRELHKLNKLFENKL